MINLLHHIHCFKIKREHNLRSEKKLLPAQSIIIPCTGNDYAKEAILSAQFAAVNAPNAEEVIIVTDQEITPEAIDDHTGKIRVAQFNPTPYTPTSHAYVNIYRSRICKLYAPNFATHERILMIDSDLMLLREPQLPWHEWGVSGSFRMGQMISKFKRSGVKKIPEPLKKTCRPYLKDHLNGAFLAAKRSVWEELSPLWTNYYKTIWSDLPDNQPPTDQLPLTCALDHLHLTTLNAGDDINWPVSKKIGGQSARIPESVIGAHGGLPLSEWEKYRQDREALLSFVDSKTTRQVRYQTDSQNKKA
jgi:hypothetical protein